MMLATKAEDDEEESSMKDQNIRKEAVWLPCSP